MKVGVGNVVVGSISNPSEPIRLVPTLNESCRTQGLREEAGGGGCTRNRNLTIVYSERSIVQQREMESENSITGNSCHFV